MAETIELRDPWLIAVWPGMGNVAIGAGAYLVDKLGATLVEEISAHALFDVQHVEVTAGLAEAGHMPRNLLFAWRNPGTGHDLLIFIGESQPNTGGYAFCHTLLEHAQKHGVRRVFTFAAMATQLHPSSAPRVFGVATQHDALQELRRLDVEVLEEGQISGLNGVLLAAAAERGVEGACLLGELPFFAAGVPNPRASHAVLEVFSRLAGVDIDFGLIQEQSQAVEQGLLELLEKMKESARQESEEQGEFDLPEFPEAADDDDESEDARPALDEPTRLRIESLFDEAHRDRNKALLLKEELDRLGVFEQYEDRFLDLFKKAE